MKGRPAQDSNGIFLGVINDNLANKRASLYIFINTKNLWKT
jgi:hypothetical protein